jgi:hypothetical protein
MSDENPHTSESSVMVYIYNPSTGEVEVGRL